MKPAKRILFIIGNLGAGGKERRLIELLTYLKKQGGYEILLILAFDKIEYSHFYTLGIQYRVINNKPGRKYPTFVSKLIKICRAFKPHIIHTWSALETFYMLPAAKLYKIPIINSQITNAPESRNRYSLRGLITPINVKLSDIVTSNSFAGLASYRLPQNGKYRVIYNGINMERFSNLSSVEVLRKHFRLNTEYAVLMVADFSDTKDYEKYLNICKQVEQMRNDITFFAVGDGDYMSKMKEKALIENLKNIRFTGRIQNVEELVSICDIGILFSTNGEGISNSILEYMASGKPVIATNAGGTKEILKHKESGYLITNESDKEIADIIIKLLNDPDLRKTWGQNGKTTILRSFTMEKMGAKFVNLYAELFPDTV
jgi:glycosyltransferase involved in cell wall biosynthesis